MPNRVREPNIAVFVDDLHSFQLLPGRVVQWTSEENGTTELRRMPLASLRVAHRRLAEFLASVPESADIIPFPGKD